MKTLSALLFVFLGINHLVYGQLFSSAYPLSSISGETSTISLANSTVAATGTLADYYINPANIGVENTLDISRKNKAFGLGGNLIYQQLTVKAGQYAFAASFRDINLGEMYAMAFPYPLYVDRAAAEDFIFSGTFAYSFKNGIRVGIGVNHGKLDNVKWVAMGDRYRRQDILKTSFNFGALYQRSVFNNDKLSIEPSAGLSLTNFGKPVYFYRGDFKNPLPTTARIGAALKIQAKETVFNQPIMGFTLTSGLSKIMSRIEVKQDSEGNYYSDPVPPAKALIDSWDKIYRFNTSTGNVDTISVREQIWTQMGVEMKLLGTLSFRLGIENAAKAEDFLDKVAYGIGLDFYFLQIEYARSFYSNGYSAGFYGFDEGRHIQFTLRIPLAEDYPKGIFHHFFN